MITPGKQAPRGTACEETIAVVISVKSSMKVSRGSGLASRIKGTGFKWVGRSLRDSRKAPSKGWPLTLDPSAENESVPTKTGEEGGQGCPKCKVLRRKLSALFKKQKETRQPQSSGRRKQSGRSQEGRGSKTAPCCPLSTGALPRWWLAEEVSEREWLQLVRGKQPRRLCAKLWNPSNHVNAPTRHFAKCQDRGCFFPKMNSFTWIMCYFSHKFS